MPPPPESFFTPQQQKRTTLSVAAAPNPAFTTGAAPTSSSFVPPSTLKRSASSARLDHDPDIQSAKRQLKQATFEASMSKSSFERKHLAFETAKRELELALKERDGRIDRLEKDRRFLAEREREEREGRERAEEAARNQRLELDRTILSLRQQLSTLREEHYSLSSSYSDLQHSSSQATARLESAVAGLQRQAAALEDDLASTREVSDQRQALLEQTRREMDRLEEEIAAGRGGAGSEETNSVVREELHRQASYLRTLESSNARLQTELTTLRERASNVDVLREEKKSLERRLRSVDELRNKLADVEAERDSLLRERQEWSQYLQTTESSSSALSSPRALTKSLAAERIANATLREQRGASAAQAAVLERRVADAEREAEDARRRAEEVEGRLRKVERLGRGMGRRVELGEMEVGLLKKQLASFTEEEVTFNAGNYDVQKAARIEALEALLEEYKGENAQLARDVDAFRKEGWAVAAPALAPAAEGGKENEEAPKERESLRRKVEELEASLALVEKQAQQTISSLEAELVTYERRVGRGEFNYSAGVRCLALADNPASQDYAIRSATLASLREENRLLLERVEKSGSGGGGGGGGGEGWVPAQTWENAVKEKEGLEKMLGEKDKRLLRLKEIFSDKAVEFREAIYSLLGYRIHFLSNGRVRLTSAFSPRPSSTTSPSSPATLVFGSGEADQGTMRLVGAEEEGAGFEGVQDLINFWVVERGSVPCFLANLTLEMWDAQARGEEGGGRMAHRQPALGADAYARCEGNSYDDAPDCTWDADFTLEGYKSAIEEFNKHEWSCFKANIQTCGLHPREAYNRKRPWTDAESDAEWRSYEYRDVPPPTDEERVLSPSRPTLQRMSYGATLAEAFATPIVLALFLPVRFVEYARVKVAKALREHGLPEEPTWLRDALKEDKRFPNDVFEGEETTLVYWTISKTLMWQKIDRRIDEVFEMLWAFMRANACIAFDPETSAHLFRVKRHAALRGPHARPSRSRTHSCAGPRRSGPRWRRVCPSVKVSGGMTMSVSSSGMPASRLAMETRATRTIGIRAGRK